MSTTLPADLTSVPEARRFLQTMLSSWQLGGVADEAAVVTSELVTNAVVHAETPFELRLCVDGSALRISVVDTGPGTPDMKFLGPGSPGGRGLHLVASLTRAWGVDQLDSGGKIVWAEVPLTPRARIETSSAAADDQGTRSADPSRAEGPSVEVPLQDLLTRLRKELAADTAAVLRLEPASQHLVTVAISGNRGLATHHHRVPLGTGFAGAIAATRSPQAREWITTEDALNPVIANRITSVLGVPLLKGSALIGVLHVGFAAHRTFDEHDIDRLEKLSSWVTRRLEHEAVVEERFAAAALQRSLVPTRLPDLDGLELAGRYVPGEGGVSGDWYDVFRLPGDRVGVVMGDVAGHGLRASVVMGRLRSALRAYALEYDDPAKVLESLDAKIFHFEPGAMATALYAITTPPFDEVRIACAGHLPPIHVDSAGATTSVSVRPDLPLGVNPKSPRATTTVPLHAGSAIVLFTDGLVERRLTTTRRGAEVFGSLDSALAELSRVIVPEPAEALSSRILDHMLTLEPPADDVAVLVLRRV